MATVQVSLNTANVKIDEFIHDMSSREILWVIKQSCQTVLVPAMRAKIQKNKSNYTGALSNSIDVMTARVNQGEASVYVGPIGVKYAMNVEKGMGPHTPDYGRISDWVRRKLKPRAPVGVVAAHIVSAIRSDGIEPRPFLMVSLEANQSRLTTDLIARLRKHLRT